MIKSKIRAVFRPLPVVIVLAILGLSIGWVQARQDACQVLKDEQLLYLDSQQKILRELIEIVSQGSADLGLAYSGLMRHVGKSLGDVSTEILRVQLVATTLNDQVSRLEAEADAYEEKTYAWVDAYSQCGWEEKIDALEEWQVINYENLETIGAFLGGYGGIIMGWPDLWEELKGGRAVEARDFDQVDEFGKGLEESIDLMSDTFEYTKEAFQAARP